MYVPRARERVRLAARSGVFLVVWVNHEQKEADLIPLHGTSFVEEIVSFSELEAYSQNRPLKPALRIQHPIAIQRYGRVRTRSDAER